MRPESIIKSVRDVEKGYHDRRIAALKGRKYVKKPTSYLNLENGEAYYAIIGSLAFPAGKSSGFALVIGVVKDDTHTAAPSSRCWPRSRNLTWWPC